MPKVYIIILNYCGAHDTIACLESVLKISFYNYQIILVDNCSPDDSINIIQKWAEGKLEVQEYNEELSSLVVPFIKKPIRYKFYNEDDIKKIDRQSGYHDLVIIKAKLNKGFSAGNNIGLQYALLQEDADYFWLINNDTLVTPNSLDELIKCHQLHQEGNRIGIVGGRLLYYSQPDTIQCLGGGIYNEFLGIVKEVGDRLPADLGNSTSKEYLDYISGACMLVKSKFIEEVGLLSEDYFLYYEELDWCTRGRMKGWNIDYTNEAVIYHKVGATVNAKQRGKCKSEKSDYYSVRSKLLYASKYNNEFVNITVRVALSGAIINRLYRRQFKRIFMIIKLLFTKY